VDEVSLRVPLDRAEAELFGVGGDPEEQAVRLRFGEPGDLEVGGYAVTLTGGAILRWQVPRVGSALHLFVHVFQTLTAGDHDRATHPITDRLKRADGQDAVQDSGSGCKLSTAGAKLLSPEVGGPLFSADGRFSGHGATTPQDEGAAGHEAQHDTWKDDNVHG